MLFLVGLNNVALPSSLHSASGTETGYKLLLRHSLGISECRFWAPFRLKMALNVIPPTHSKRLFKPWSSSSGGWSFLLFWKSRRRHWPSGGWSYVSFASVWDTNFGLNELYDSGRGKYPFKIVCGIGVSHCLASSFSLVRAWLFGLSFWGP